MAQPNNPKSHINTTHKPYVSRNIKHRTVTLHGIHNKNKALYRLGVTADEIHRSKALLTMGGTEDIYQHTLQYCSHNHHPTPSLSYVKKTKPNHTLKNQGLPLPQDPLEHEYTRNSQTPDTIDQNMYNIEKRESASLSITWTHSHNTSNNPYKSNKSSSSGSTDDIYKINENTPCIDDDGNEHSSEDGTNPNPNDKYVKKNPHMPRLSHQKKNSYAQDDINNDKNPITSKKLFHKRKSDSFFMNNHNVIMPRIYHRKYQSKNSRKMSNNNASNSTPKNWYQFDDNDINKTNNNINNKPENKENGYQSWRTSKTLSKPSKPTTINPYSHPTKISSTISTKNMNKKNKENRYDLSNDVSDDLNEKKRKKSSKSEKKLRKPSKSMDKKEERDRWKLHRETRGFHPDSSDVINSSEKVRKFFGDNPLENHKLNWKLGETVNDMMDMRSIDIINITEKADNVRKKEKKQFTRKAKLIRKISQIKLKWAAKTSTLSSRNLNLNEIESKNFLSHSSFSDADEHDGNDCESGASTQSTKSNMKSNMKTDMDGHSDIDQKINDITIKISLKNQNKTQNNYINGIRNGVNGGYHIDQSLFTFQNPNKSVNPINKQRISSYLQTKERFYRKKKKNNVHRYGFKANGKINIIEINKQIGGLKKLLASKKTLSEIISIYYQQYGFCVDFIVSLLSTIDETCPQYIMVVGRHVDKQMKILHNLSLWQYILRHQLSHIDIRRFFYSFGPLIGKYKTLISPLHLSARKLIEIGGGKESHITSSTSTPQCLYAFETFKWLLFVGYDIDDGDIYNTITPQTILNHAPRILKQILVYQRQFLFKQRQCMKMVDNCTYKQYKILLDDDILQVIEKFTYHKYRKSRAGFGHKKFVKT